HDAIRAHHQALAGWFRQAALWTRTGEGAAEVLGGLPEPPALSGPGDHLTALATWYGLLHQDIRSILDEVGPQPQPVIGPSVGNASMPAGGVATFGPVGRCSPRPRNGPAPPRPRAPPPPVAFGPAKRSAGPPGPRRRGPTFRGAGEHGSPIAVARRHRPQPCP